MVKPSKSMQPEHVDLQQASRRTGSGAAFGEDSFHNYMAVKIAAQRKQFGLVLPPPPPPQITTAAPSKPSVAIQRPIAAENKRTPLHVSESFSSRKRSPSQAKRPLASPKRPASVLKSSISRAAPKESSVPYKRPTLLERRSLSGFSQPPPLHHETDHRPTRDDTVGSSDRSVRFLDEVVDAKGPKRRRSKMESMIHRLKRRHGRGNKKLETYTKTKKQKTKKQDAHGEKGEPSKDKQTIETLVVEGSPQGDGLSELLRMFETDVPSEEVQKKHFVGKGLEMEKNSLKFVPADEERPVVEDNLSELARLFSAEDVEKDDDLPTSVARAESEKTGMDPAKNPQTFGETTTSPKPDSLESEDYPNVMEKTTIGADSPLAVAPPSPKSIRKSRPDLFFYGVVVKVAGYTYPDNETIKRLLQKHGGDLETYETERVTHIIAQQLSTAKANVYKKARRPRPVCRPTWIVDSVRERRLLPFGNYLLVEEREQQQMGIQSMFRNQTATARGHKDASPLPIQNEKSKPNNPYLKTKKDESSKHAGKGDPRWFSSEVTVLKSPPKLPKESRHGKPTSPQKNDSEKSKSPQKIDTKSSPRKKEPWDPVRTIGTDPNFLDSYFASSRLSFIGSFKQRSASTLHSAKSSTTALSSRGKKLIFHVDMDCFFASVAIRNFPQYRDKPVVISHHGKSKSADRHSKGDNFDSFHQPSSHQQSTHIPKNSYSECATCNYEARKYGIKKGMFLGRAKELCPELIVLSYDFQGYEEVSQQVSEILDRLAYSDNHNGVVEMVSCDEAYVELNIDADGLHDTETIEVYDRAYELAESVRNEIFETTQCTASIGVGDNKFLAKLGTDKAKPNKSYCVRDHRELLKDLNLRDMHGVGWRTEKKLTEEGLVTVQDVWDLGPRGETELTRILGPGTGSKIFRFTQGKDDRTITPVERKTIGAECNYGVRFDGPYGIDHFMEGLAKEVEKRMVGIEMKGKKLTLKIKRRKEGCGMARKFLGHGSCHNLSKSANIPGNMPTRDSKVFKKIGMSLFQEFGIDDINDVRGMGITISSLENDDITGKESDAHGMKSWLQKNIQAEPIELRDSVNKAVEGSREETLETDIMHSTPDPKRTTETVIEEDEEKNGFAANIESPLMIDLPPMSQIKMTQVEALPPEFQEQIRSRMKQAAFDISDGGDGVGNFDSERADGRMTIDETELRDTSIDEDDSMQFKSPSKGISGIDTEDDDIEVIETKMNESPLMIELPPMSQIQMSQVEALPPDLQRQILSRMKGNTTTTTATSRCAMEEDNGIETTGKALHGNNVVPKQQQHFGSGLQDQASSRFRQTDLKRMMKLAAVRSGRESTSISLSQLDQLPLEIKLQVVNHDDRQVGVLSQHASRASNASARHRRKSAVAVANPGDSSLPPKATTLNSNPAVRNKGPEQNPQNETTEKQNANSNQKKETSDSQRTQARKVRLRIIDRVDSWKEDVRPLKEFLDNHCPVQNPDAIHKVIDFLSIVVKEGRSTAMVTMMRSIRNRKDYWSALVVLEEIARAMNDLYIELHGSGLDVGWLMGTVE